jgi:hypothetical protein
LTRTYFDVSTAASDGSVTAADEDDEDPAAAVAVAATAADEDVADDAIGALPSDIAERDDSSRVRLLGPPPLPPPSSRRSSDDGIDVDDVCDCSLPLSASRSGDHDRFFFVVVGRIEPVAWCHSGGIVDHSDSVPGASPGADAGARKGNTVDNDDEEDAEANEDSNRRCLAGC